MRCHAVMRVGCETKVEEKKEKKNGNWGIELEAAQLVGISIYTRACNTCKPGEEHRSPIASGLLHTQSWPLIANRNGACPFSFPCLMLL